MIVYTRETALWKCEVKEYGVNRSWRDMDRVVKLRIFVVQVELSYYASTGMLDRRHLLFDTLLNII